MLLTTYPLISSYTHNGDDTLQSFLPSKGHLSFNLFVFLSVSFRQRPSKRIFAEFAERKCFQEILCFSSFIFFYSSSYPLSWLRHFNVLIATSPFIVYLCFFFLFSGNGLLRPGHDSDKLPPPPPTPPPPPANFV